MWNRIPGIILAIAVGSVTPALMTTGLVATGAPSHPVDEPKVRQTATPAARPTPAPPQSPIDDAASIELIESWPAETNLDHPDIRDAAEAWVELIDGAKGTLDVAEFYLSDDPQGGGRLRSVVAAIERAAARGVRIRILVEEAFYRTYPELPDRFAKVAGCTVRRLDSKAFSRGILHAKYFLVDRTTACIGSQNFDWRALDQIQELGLILRGEGPTRLFNDLFELDWELAGAIPVGTFAPGTAKARADSVLARHRVSVEAREFPVTAPDGTPLGTLMPVASPIGRLPNREIWDEPRLIDLLDSARSSVNLQLLNMTPLGRDSTYYPDLEGALKRAAARGVTVRILVSDWCKSANTLRHLKALAHFPGVEIRFMVIPQGSGGFVPFSRTIHAKYLTVDGERFWLGTSNWERDYFHESRNVGVIGHAPALAARLAAFFSGNWGSIYAEPLDPAKSYTPPRVGR